LTKAFGCSAEAGRELARGGRVRGWEERDAILRRGDRSTCAYLLLDGRAHALVYTLEGQIVLLHDYRAGDLFGALGDLSAPAEPADVIAVAAVRAFLLEAAALVTLAERHGAIGLALSRLLLKRLRATSERMYERAALSAPGRVCAELLRLAGDGDGHAIRPVPILAELALRVGTTRETASRTVHALERRGILRRDSDCLVVVAPGRLEGEMV
jgi:CRP-like cAMP-binding protein